jgi:hypothetical protein
VSGEAVGGEREVLRAGLAEYGQASLARIRDLGRRCGLMRETIKWRSVGHSSGHQGAIKRQSRGRREAIKRQSSGHPDAISERVTEDTWTSSSGVPMSSANVTAR